MDGGDPSHMLACQGERSRVGDLHLIHDLHQDLAGQICELEVFAR